MQQRKRRQRVNEEKDRETRNSGYVHAVIMCSHPPPFSPLSSARPASPSPRLWLSGQEVQQEAPPVTHTPFEHSETSALDLCDSLSLEVISTKTDIGQWSDYFLFLPIFDRTPVSRDSDCYSLAKICEILAGADILSAPYLWRFLHGGPVHAGTVRERVHPERQGGQRQQHTWWLHVERSTSSGRSRRTLARPGRSQLLRTLLGQNSKEMLPRMRQLSVGTWILSKAIFCWWQYFVDANILSTPIFCRCQYFVAANIL